MENERRNILILIMLDHLFYLYIFKILIYHSRFIIIFISTLILKLLTLLDDFHLSSISLWSISSVRIRIGIIVCSFNIIFNIHWLLLIFIFIYLLPFSRFLYSVITVSIISFFRLLLIQFLYISSFYLLGIKNLLS